MFWTIPTLMTWTRIIAIPLIVGFLRQSAHRASQPLIATVMFVVFAATDWDGFFTARKLNQTSSFGLFWLADKFLVHRC
jgi:CDP-diacylglycerol--glycerol-3-phosphate 3-phosphatidyltransferase